MDDERQNNEESLNMDDLANRESNEEPQEILKVDENETPLEQEQTAIDDEPTTNIQPIKKRKRVGLWVGGVILLICISMVGGIFLSSIIPGLKTNQWLQSIQPTATTSAIPQNTAQPTWDPQKELVLGGQPFAIGQNTLVDISKNMMPSIVPVHNKAVRRRNGVEQTADQGVGTGIIITTDGYIVTNYHVVENADALTVELKEGTEVAATLIGADARKDLAVIKIESKDLIPAPLGNSTEVKVGETAIAFGNPLGLGIAPSLGIISKIHQNLQLDDSGRGMSLIQTSAPINPGNSGGALVNIKGQVIGINTLKITFAGYDASGSPISAEGIGFAIPINEVKPIVEEIIKQGHVERAWMGIEAREVTEYDDLQKGILIRGVVTQSPAQKAGLQAGDIIVGYNDIKINVFEDLTNALDQSKVGQSVTIKVYRPSMKKEIEFMLTLAQYVG